MAPSLSLSGERGRCRLSERRLPPSPHGLVSRRRGPLHYYGTGRTGLHAVLVSDAGLGAGEGGDPLAHLDAAGITRVDAGDAPRAALGIDERQPFLHDGP